MNIFGNLFLKKQPSCKKDIIYYGFEPDELGDIFQIHDNLFIRFTLEKQNITNQDLTRFDRAIYNHVLTPVTNPDEVFIRNFYGDLKYKKNEEMKIGEETISRYGTIVSDDKEDKDKRIFLVDWKKQYKKSSRFLNHILKEYDGVEIFEKKVGEKEKGWLIQDNIEAVFNEYSATLNDKFAILKLEIFTDKEKTSNFNYIDSNYEVINFKNIIISEKHPEDPIDNIRKYGYFSALLRALYINPIQYYLLKFLEEKYNHPNEPFFKVADREIIDKFNTAKKENPKYHIPFLSDAFCSHNQFDGWFISKDVYRSGKDKELRSVIFKTLRIITSR